MCSSTRRTWSRFPRGSDAAEAETLVVNGITAWQMLHRKARIRSRADHPGARRQRRRGSSWSSSAGHGRQGDRHSFRTPPRRACASSASSRSTTTTRLAARVRELVPGGVTPSSTTSVAAASSPPATCSRPAARSSPTAAPRLTGRRQFHGRHVSRQCSPGSTAGTCYPIGVMLEFLQLLGRTPGVHRLVPPSPARRPDGCSPAAEGWRAEADDRCDVPAQRSGGGVRTGRVAHCHGQDRAAALTDAGQVRPRALTFDAARLIRLRGATLVST